MHMCTKIRKVSSEMLIAPNKKAKLSSPEDDQKCAERLQHDRATVM